MWLLLIVFAEIAVAFFCMIWSFMISDRLLRLQYELHHDAWIADGRPLGFFWAPKGASKWAGSFARTSVSFSRLIQTPVWCRDDPNLCRQLRRMRWLTLLGGVMSVLVLPTLVGGILRAP